MWKFLFIYFILSNSLMAKECYPYRGDTLCVPSIGEKDQISINPIINKLFNTSANYSGPNCYNAVLVASEILPLNTIRYISPEEFEYYLEKFFEPTHSLMAGDIVVYESTTSRGHAAISIGENLVFHKKSFHKNYLYRIVPILEVGKIEKNEWQPTPYDNFYADFDVNIGKTSKAYYKKRLIPLEDKFTSQDIKVLEILKFIEMQLIKDGPNWAVGKNMGLITEYFLSHFSSYVEKNNYHEFVYAKMISLKDQVFQSIEEMYYSRSLSTSNVERITNEICFHQNDFTKALIKMTASFLNKDPLKTNDLIFSQLQNINRSKCQVNLFQMIQDLN